MASLVWKRKANGHILKDVSKAFEANSKEDKDELIESGSVDWISLAPKRRVIQLEDAIIKSNRLKQEGTTLAEAERYWEAIRKWDDALTFTPSEAKLYEMKAQALLMLNEIYPAVLAAQKCVELSNSWWVGFQTLGRSQLALGEVRLAVRSFSNAIHLNPADDELWNEDLRWSVELLTRKTLAEEEEELKKTDVQKIVEIDSDDGESVIAIANSMRPNDERRLNLEFRRPVTDGVHEGQSGAEVLKRIPTNYVCMRD